MLCLSRPPLHLVVDWTKGVRQCFQQNLLDFKLNLMIAAEKHDFVVVVVVGIF